MNAAKIFVGNLDFATTHEDLRKLFQPFGDVQGINIRKDRKTGRPRGFAFVTFDDEASATRAISEMHLKEHQGRVLTVKPQLARGTGPAPATDNTNSGSVTDRNASFRARVKTSHDDVPPGGLLFAGTCSSDSDSDGDGDGDGRGDTESNAVKRENHGMHGISAESSSTAPASSSAASAQMQGLVQRAEILEHFRNHYELGVKPLRHENASSADSIESIFKVRFDQAHLLPFPKSFLPDEADTAHPRFRADSVPEDVSTFWAQKKITVTSTEASTLVPAPFRAFKDSPFPESFRAILQDKFTEPTPIQNQAWPMLLTGCNLIGVVRFVANLCNYNSTTWSLFVLLLRTHQADTGSGKTLAFLLPALVHILASPLHRANCRSFYKKDLLDSDSHPFRGPIAVVMAPTRELASQINEAAADFVRCRTQWLLRNRPTVDESMGKWKTHVAACPPVST